jgi:hypothetical protein
MQGRRPTSQVINELLQDLPPGKVSLAWLIGRFHRRSFGMFMLILAVMGLAPGIALFAGFVLLIPAAQMMLGHDRPSLPQFLARRSIASASVERWTRRTLPFFRHIETIIRPRWHTPFETTKRLVGFVIFLLAVSTIWPLPFSYVIPSLAIALLSLAYMEEDGILLTLALAFASLSFVVTGTIVFATMRATVLLWPIG